MSHLSVSPSSRDGKFSEESEMSPRAGGGSGSSLALPKSRSIPDGVKHALKQSGKKLDAIVRDKHEQGPLVEDAILETLDYDAMEDAVNEQRLESDSERLQQHFWTLLALKMLMTVLIGFVTAILMYGVNKLNSLIFKSKISLTTDLITSGSGAAAFFFFVFANLLITGVASSCCSILAPHARGGGVPYVTAYLNGTNVSQFFSVRIVLVKAFALIFTIAGSLSLGQEGPFCYLGAGVAIICSSAIDKIFHFLSSSATNKYTRIIHNIKEERIFMAGGLAAGLAVAFDAPIAGILMSLEGATAFLSVPVVLRIFGCAMFASFFKDLSYTNFSEEVINHNLIDTALPEDDRPPYAWTLPEAFAFLFLGLVGGCLGAAATWINIQMARWRHHAMSAETWKGIGKCILEIAIFSFITSLCWFTLPYMYGCRAVHPQCDAGLSAELPVRCRQLQCDSGYYSELGTIVYSSSDQIGRLLFDRTTLYSNDFSMGPLIAYGFIYFLLVSTLYGAFVPGGLFVPSIIIGGVYGRVTGLVLKSIFPSSFINPGVYALLGAASMLGGFTRLALPVVIMLIELTGDATYLLPIMLCAVIAKVVSDWLYPPLYPQHMELEKIPSLSDKLNPAIAKLQAQHVMMPVERMQTLRVIEKLKRINQVLSLKQRVLFPLVNERGQLCGLIKTRLLMYARTHANVYPTYAEAQRQASDHSELYEAENQLEDWHSNTVDYSHTIHKESLGEMKDLDEMFVNLASFMDDGVITCRPMTPTKRILALFRRVGMSHCCVTDRENKFLGIITRRHLITPPDKLKAEREQDNKSHNVEEEEANADDEIDSEFETQTQARRRNTTKKAGQEEEEEVVINASDNEAEADELAAQDED